VLNRILVRWDSSVSEVTGLLCQAEATISPFVTAPRQALRTTRSPTQLVSETYLRV